MKNSFPGIVGSIIIIWVLAYFLSAFFHAFPAWTIVCDKHGRYSFTGPTGAVVDTTGFASRKVAEETLRDVRQRVEHPELYENKGLEIQNWTICK